MPTIHVLRPFKLLLDHSQGQQSFGVGVHDVDEEVADHWYVQQFLSHPDAAPAAEGGEGATVEGEQGAALAPVPGAPSLDALTDEQLREILKARDGRYPHPATAREKLMAAVQAGPGAASDEPEGEAETAGEAEASADAQAEGGEGAAVTA